MTTPLEVYNAIYKVLKVMLAQLYPTMSEDKISRAANKFAVKHTWNFYTLHSNFLTGQDR